MSELPPGWATAAIRELCTLENGRAFKPSEWTEHGAPIVRIQNLNHDGASFNHFAGEVSERYRLRGGELLFAWSGTPGTSFGAHVWRGGEAVLNQHIFRVDFDESAVEKRFFRHAINQKLEELIDVAHGGVGLRHVTKGVFENTEVLVPPLPEQKRIADKLDALLTRVDACRERLDCVPGILKQFRQSVLAAATSGELTREWREERGRSMDWSCERSADVCAKVQSGGTPKEGFVESPGVPFLKVYNIVGQKVAFDYRPQFVTRSIHQGPLAKSQTRPGDVLMNIVGPPLGKVAIVPSSHSEWNINQALALFRPSPRITTGWLYAVLCSGANVRAIAHETKGSAGQTNISLSQCRDFEFPVPLVDEQEESVRRLDELLALAEKIEVRLGGATRLVEKVAPALLAKAFRGELVPHDPNDEPASQLLARIRTHSTSTGGTSQFKRGSRRGPRDRVSAVGV